MDSLDDGSFEAARGEQVWNGTAVTERIDAPARLGRVIEIRFHPLMAFNQLIQHGEVMTVGFVCHHPTARGDLESTFIDEFLQSSLSTRMRLLPPHIQITYFRPDERHVGELRHLRRRQVYDLSRVRLEIIDEGFQPSGIVV